MMKFGDIKVKDLIAEITATGRSSTFVVLKIDGHCRGDWIELDMLCVEEDFITSLAWPRDRVIERLSPGILSVIRDGQVMYKVVSS
jgi:hypothetical protein